MVVVAEDVDPYLPGEARNVVGAASAGGQGRYRGVLPSAAGGPDDGQGVRKEGPRTT